jgi:hypothetical protein
MHAKSAVLLAAVFTASVAIQTLAGFHHQAPKAALGETSALQPVVLELFTSEGCSSCPPADAFVKQLDDAGQTDDVEIIAIEEHVDYWDRLGWRDPFSSHDWTERQEQYARAFHHDGPFTPQFVVNGRSELSGSSARKARQDIVEAAKLPGADLHLRLNSVSPRSVEFYITVGSLPPEGHSAHLLLAVTERGLSSNVLRGENEGRNLSHAPVLRSLTRLHIPQENPSGVSEMKAKIALDPSWKRENLRFVIFLQDQKSLHIVGAAMSTIPH